MKKKKTTSSANMSPAELIEHISGVFARCINTAKLKNADYSGEGGNAFKNFELVEYLGVTDAATGLLVRLSDKFARAANLLHKNPAVVEEKLEDTLEDAINYLAILHAYIANKNRKSK